MLCSRYCQTKLTWKKQWEISLTNYLKQTTCMNRLLLNTAFISCLMLAACKKKQPPPNPEVPVNLLKVTPKTVLYYDKYPATTRALNQVNLLPQVAGAVTGMFFREGTKVDKGQKLYEIDERL